MNYKKNKICFVTSCLSGGGAERVIATVASYIAKENNLLISGGSDCHGNNKINHYLGSGAGNLNIDKSIINNWNIEYYK